MEQPGPFDHAVRTNAPESRDRAATIIVAVAIVLGLLLLVLILPPISILQSDNGSSNVDQPVIAKPRDTIPPSPSGFQAVSALYDLQSERPVNRSARLTVALSSRVDLQQELYLYTYEGDAWKRLVKATPIADGAAARGDVSSLPSNVAVFRPAETSVSIFGTLPADGELDNDAKASLTTLSPAGYTPDADGTIAGSIAILPNDLAAPIEPAISASDATSAGALNQILSSAEGISAHAQAIESLVADESYAGITLDYRAIDPQQGAQFVSLVTTLSSQLHQSNKTLTLVLPAPAHQGNAWDTLGYDWDKLGPLADTIEVVPADGPGSSYAALSDALQYLTAHIDGSKLLLSVDSLSEERGPDGTRSMTLTDALTLAGTPAVQGSASVQAGASVQVFGQNLSTTSGATGIRWDGDARAVSFTYTGGGGQRTVWLANAFSEAFRLDLVQRYHLGGIAIDDVSTHASDSKVAALAGLFAKSGDVSLVQPNGKLLEPTWTASGGTLAKDSGAAVTWQAPDAAGDYTLTLIVSDGLTRVGQQLQVSVRAGAQATP
jgi:spore germination protein YaaH